MPVSIGHAFICTRPWDFMGRTGVKYKACCIPLSPEMKPVISQASITMMLDNDSKAGVITLLGWQGENCNSCDPVFFSLLLDGVLYTHMDDKGFSQWAYLVFPDAFKSALRGTRLERVQSLCYCTDSKCRLIQSIPKQKPVLRWQVSVNYLVSTCSADGLGIEPRNFELDFYHE